MLLVLGLLVAFPQASPAIRESILLPTGTKVTAVHNVHGGWQTLSGEPVAIKVDEGFHVGTLDWGIVLTPKRPYDLSSSSSTGIPSVDLASPKLAHGRVVSPSRHGFLHAGKDSVVALFQFSSKQSKCPTFTVAEGKWKIVSSEWVKDRKRSNIKHTDSIVGITFQSGRKSLVAIQMLRPPSPDKFAYTVRAGDGNSQFISSGTTQKGNFDTWYFEAGSATSFRVDVLTRPYTKLKFMP